MSVLASEGLSAKLGGRLALDCVDMRVASGEILALAGPNGAGKTTLLRTLAGLLKPSAGRATLDGALIHTLPAAKRAQRIGYLAQESQAHWPIPVRDLVMLGRLPYRGRWSVRPDAADAAAVERALGAQGLLALADRAATELSGGELRRALLARALAGAPEVILADEPTGGLDPGCQLDVMDALRRAADAGAAVVFATHDLALAGRYADRVLMLRGGRVAALGPPATTLTAAMLAQCYGVRPATGNIFAIGPLERVDDRGDMARD